MIIWLASYPKSGNTLLRSLLCAYFYTDTGNLKFDALNNIKQFPDSGLFRNLGIDISNDYEVIKNYIKVQEAVNKFDKNRFRLVKTHSTLHKIEGYPFTNLTNTLGVVYVVRDPRNVSISYAHHNQMTIDEACESLINFRVLGGEKTKTPIRTHIANWSSHYQTWKAFKSLRKYLLVKYEDLIIDKKNTFLKVLEFIYKLNKIEFIVDYQKLNNAIESTSFENMQLLEKKYGFEEAAIDKNNNKINFFHLGKKNRWEDILDKNIRKKIEKSFKKEMKELGYL